ncbi:Aste57867_8702 [Aphanomyces stellatus]|uniref:Aste57867_8702 protein n=1 Tax=Aphanomyces stellatus TaxID=120398 RepID=A0A485KL06_9STRA|nr:hypothetical protein As57867_008668 [Aphanomyces stellatus]VFT85588.1 Aste57867_8702 [Aphanomyces stellatus]
MDLDWDLNILKPHESLGTQLVRRGFGPFAAIDIHWVPKPPSLRGHVQRFHAESYQSLANSAIVLVPTTLDPIPLGWMDGSTQFYGGNPLCRFGEPQPYVQMSFGYHDACTAQVPLTVDMSTLLIVFAMQRLAPEPLSDKDVLTFCQLCQTTESTCLSMLHTGAGPSRPRGVVDQHERRSTRRHVVVVHPLVQSPDAGDPWTFFGWVMVYDWLVGRREVYRFEGDDGAMTLMSTSEPPQTLAANPLELPQHACTYIWGISVYVSAALVAWGHWPGCMLSLCVASVLTASISLNRVVGAVWIGHPMLFFRGITALIVLNVQFGVVHDLSLGPPNAPRVGARCGRSAVAHLRLAGHVVACHTRVAPRRSAWHALDMKFVCRAGSSGPRSTRSHCTGPMYIAATWPAARLQKRRRASWKLDASLLLGWRGHWVFDPFVWSGPASLPATGDRFDKRASTMPLGGRAAYFNIVGGGDLDDVASVMTGL